MTIYSQILTQTLYYALVMVITIVVIAILQRGFFWKYIKVKISFGKYVMIKIRTTLRDYFIVGHVEDGFLVYKRKKVEMRLSLGKDINYFYRTLGINWVDVDEEKGALCKVDYASATGHDPEKESNLYIRALTRPSVADNREKIIFFLIIAIGIIALVTAFLVYSNYTALKDLVVLVQNTAVKNVVVGGSALI